MSIEPEFGGDTYSEPRDRADFHCQIDEVRSIMLGGGWHTLAELARTVRQRIGKPVSEAGMSARLRDLRKTKFGAYNIEKRVRAGSKRLYEYHLGGNTAPLSDFAHGKIRSESAGAP